MINRILWGIRKPDDIKETQKYVELLATSYNSKIYVINVIPNYQNFVEAFTEEEKNEISSWINRTLMPNGKDMLNKVADELGEKNINYEVRVEQGIPSQTIINAARSFEVDLILLGKGRAENTSLLGGTALKVIRNSEIPVLCINNKELKDFKEIVVPNDLDYSQTNTLNYAVNFAKPFKSKIHNLNVVEIGEHYIPNNIIQKFKENSQLQMSDKFSDPKLSSDVQTYVEADHNAWMGIVKYANEKNSDLIIMNTHGQQRSKFLGSVTEKVIQEAPCPVLTMKPVN
ncbi:MAG: universal stress protein [Thermodesulfobacteriota bacterium]